MKYLYLLIAVLATAVVALDHYTIRKYLNEVQNVESIQFEQELYIDVAVQAIQFADRGLAIAEQQSNEIATLDKQLQKAIGIVKSLQSELDRAYKVIEQDGEIIKDLTDQNSNFRGKVDSYEMDIKLYKRNNYELTTKLISLKEENEKLQTIINKLQKQLKINFEYTITPLPDGGPK